MRDFEQLWDRHHRRVHAYALRRTDPSPAPFAETFRVSPAAQADPAAGVLRQRVATLGVHGWRIESRGGRLFATCAGCSAALPRSVTQPGDLRIYDWEASVLGARCRPDPQAQDVTSGAAAGRAGPGSLSHEAAEQRAARCPGSRLVHGLDPAAWYVLRDRPAFTGRQLTDPRVASLHGEPMVTLRFTPDGRTRWHALTRRLVERGRQAQRPGEDRIVAAQHFAVVLDDRVLVVPYVNPQVNPRGLHGLEIAGGFTVAQARTLVALLKSGALPAHVTAAPPSHPAA